MLPKVLIICLDGCAPAYLQQGVTPNIEAMGREGFQRLIHASVPSVTNVNHATILTGSYPDDHGVTGNLWYDRGSKGQGFIEDQSFLRRETILDLYARRGARTALLAVKGKVLGVFGRHVNTGLCVEHPTPELVVKLGLGEPPPVATAEANVWLLEACYRLIARENPDLVYCTTNDYIMHRFAPESEEAKRQMAAIDTWLGRILTLDPKREVYLTADHGMNSKKRVINMQKKLNLAGLDVLCLPVIKDRYLENHRYQEGGVLYLYLRRLGQVPALLEILHSYPFVDRLFSREEAAVTFHLPPDRIGDWVIFATPESAFGETEEEEISVSVRTHGSLYEVEIPLVAVNARRPAEDYTSNRDMVRFLCEDLNF